jgi:hypothetical protein
MDTLTPKGARRRAKTSRIRKKCGRRETASSLQSLVASSVEPPKPERPFFIRLRGKPRTEITIPEIQQGLLEIAGALAVLRNDGLSVDWATLSISIRDRNGKRIYPDPSGEWVIPIYKSAADEFKL